MTLMSLANYDPNDPPYGLIRVLKCLVENGNCLLKGGVAVDLYLQNHSFQVRDFDVYAVSDYLSEFPSLIKDKALIGDAYSGRNYHDYDTWTCFFPVTNGHVKLDIVFPPLMPRAGCHCLQLAGLSNSIPTVRPEWLFWDKVLKLASAPERKMARSKFQHHLSKLKEIIDKVPLNKTILKEAGQEYLPSVEDINQNIQYNIRFFSPGNATYDFPIAIYKTLESIQHDA